MHEASIIEALIEAVRQEVHNHPAGKVQLVRVRAGALRQVVPEIMRLCFEAATRDTDLADARLELEVVPARARCQKCQDEFPVTENWFECPRCKSVEARILSGQELDLTGIELVESAT